MEDTFVEASPSTEVVTFEDASVSNRLSESTSTFDQLPFHSLSPSLVDAILRFSPPLPTLLVDLALPSVSIDDSIELESEISTTVVSTSIAETPGIDDLAKSTSSTFDQLPFHTLSPSLVDAILRFSPNNTSIALETEVSTTVMSTASAPGTSDSNVLSESTSSVIPSMSTELAEETITTTAVLAESPVNEDSSDIDQSVIIVDSDTHSDSRPSTTPAAVVSKLPADLVIFESKNDAIPVNESSHAIVLEVSTVRPGALLSAPEVSALKDFGGKSNVADGSSTLGTLAPHTQEFPKGLPTDRVSSLPCFKFHLMLIVGVYLVDLRALTLSAFPTRSSVRHITHLRNVFCE